VRFQGAIDQCPPAFSAVKIRGRKAYKFARAKRQVNMPPRRVEALEIELLEYSWPCVLVRLVTSAGFTSARSRDLGEVLGTGGTWWNWNERRRLLYEEEAIRLADWAGAAARMPAGRIEQRSVAECAEYEGGWSFRPEAGASRQPQADVRV
jgi:tRNA U55 pseudouridine synthase TruB